MFHVECVTRSVPQLVMTQRRVTHPARIRSRTRRRRVEVNGVATHVTLNVSCGKRDVSRHSVAALTRRDRDEHVTSRERPCFTTLATRNVALRS